MEPRKQHLESGIEKSSVNWGCSHHLRGNTLRFNIMMVIYTYNYIYIYVYINTYMGITCFTALTQCFQVFYILYVHVSEMLCTFQRCCARVRDVVHVSQQLCTFHRSCAHFPAVVHVSQKLCTCHRSCARFTNPLITSCSTVYTLSAF